MRKQLLFCAILMPILGWSQVLRFSYVEHDSRSLENVPLEMKIAELVPYLKGRYHDFSFDTVVLSKTDYFTSANDVSMSTIGTLKPAVYLRIQEKLQSKLKPIFIVKKRGSPEPYYTSYIIIRKGQGVDSLSSPKIKKLFFASANSVSGFIAPLHKLWELNVISNPSLKSIAEELGWEIDSTRRNEDVLDRMSRSDDVAIGFTGELPPEDSDFEVMFRFSLLPQDVLFISPDLLQYEDGIRAFLNDSLINTGVLEGSSAKISGLVAFGVEHKMAYQDLSRMIDRVVGTADRSSWSLKFGNFKSRLSFADLVEIFKNTDSALKYVLSVLVTITSIIGVVASLKKLFRRRTDRVHMSNEVESFIDQ